MNPYLKQGDFPFFVEIWRPKFLYLGNQAAKRRLCSEGLHKEQGLIIVLYFIYNIYYNRHLRINTIKNENILLHIKYNLVAMQRLTRKLLANKASVFNTATQSFLYTLVFIYFSGSH